MKSRDIWSHLPSTVMFRVGDGLAPCAIHIATLFTQYCSGCVATNIYTNIEGNRCQICACVRERCAVLDISGWSLIPSRLFCSSRPLTRTKFLTWHDDANLNHEEFVVNKVTRMRCADNISISFSTFPEVESGPYRACTVIL